MKVDLYKHKERYENWKEEALKNELPGVSKVNSEIILNYEQIWNMD